MRGKKLIIKRVLSILLIIFITLQCIPKMASMEYVNAAEDSLTATRGVYWFDPHEVGKDLTDTFIYDENLLKGDSKAYNQKLATMTFELAVASISSEREPRTVEGYKNKSRNLRAYLEDNGFVDFETNQYYKEKMTTSTMGAAVAHKKIVDGGKEYTLLAIVPRSAGYEAEWGGNFVLGEKEDHAGFRNGKDIVLDFAKKYIAKYKISGDIKVWTSGYSRGAGVTNQVAASLIDNPKAALGNSISLTPGNLYCYTFGTPKSAGDPDSMYDNPTGSRFDYIHNTWQAYDLVSVVPPKSFGFERYGKNFTYAKPENKARMLKFLKDTNPTVYDIYMNGGDPDQFKTKTLDIKALIDNRELKITDDDNSYLPPTQEEFMALMEESLQEAVKNRNIYVNGGYQDALEHFASYFMTNMSNVPIALQGAKDSGLAIPMLVTMYLSYMTERYSTTNFDEKTKDEIEKAIESLEKAIAEKKAAGEEVPQELIDKVAELKQKLSTAATWSNVSDILWEITAILYRVAMQKGLSDCGLDTDDKELYDKMTSQSDARAMTRILAYLALYDKNQTDKVISLTTVSQQVKHLSTFAGNAKSFMRPHNNEVILSWLRTLDSSYDDFVKENNAQIAGYRRLYIERPAGVTVTGTVKDESGKTVAEFRNDVMTSRTDTWIGITTCDTGNWLRLPLDKTYKVELKADKDTTLNLKAAEYDIYSNKEVRTETKDKNYNWTGLEIKKANSVTWVISAVTSGTDGNYKLASNAEYYIEKPETPAAKQILVAKGVSKNKTSVNISWNKIKGADRYVVYFAKCKKNSEDDDDSTKLSKVKTLSGAKLTWKVKGLKKKTAYRFRVVALKKVNGKYKKICTSRIGHFVTGNVKGRYTNPKSITVKSKLSVKVSKKARIKATVKKEKKNKKLMTTHTSLLRYTSNNPEVATVSSKGVVTGKSKGECVIYVQTINGIWKKVNVTVK